MAKMANLNTFTGIIEHIRPYIRHEAEATGVFMNTQINYCDDTLFLSAVYEKNENHSILLTREEVEQRRWMPLVEERVRAAIQAVKPDISLSCQADEYEETMKAEEIIEELTPVGAK
jgi:hypothetical protein